MANLRTIAQFGILVLGCTVVWESAAARYTGSGPACVSGVGQNDRLNVRSRPSANSRILGSLAPGQCGMNIESVEGTWTFIRGNDRGRNIQGWVNNRFLRAKSQAQQIPQTGGGSGFPVRAASGGGVVRGGPGTNFRRLGSLRQFEPVTVLGNTGVMMNGYPWFQIQYRGGRRGYQWGGLICSLDRPFGGTFDTCANFRRTLQGSNTAPPPPQPSRRRVSYSCNEGIPLNVTFLEDRGQSFAIYSHDSGPQIRLRIQPSGSGFSYGDGFSELRGKGREITLIEQGQVIDRCFAN